MKKYSAWGNAEGDSYTFIEGTEMPPEILAMEPELVLLKEFEANSWNEAMQLYYDWQKWGIYKPIADE